MVLIYPKAEWTPTGVDGGAMLGGEPRCVWHTTETHPSAFFTAKTYYHIQVREYGGRILWRQFIDFERASRALRREDNIQTNRRGSFCPNVALVAYAKDSAGLSDAMVNEIGEFVAFAERTMGVPPVFPRPFLGGEAYGYDGAARLTAQQWTDFTGHCGHQHVYRNTHWDPGRFPVDRILATLEDDMDPELVEFVKWLKAEIESSDDSSFDGSVDKAKARGVFTQWTADRAPITAAKLAVFLDRAGALDVRQTGVIDEVARSEISKLRNHLRQA